jgi:hypothetical protein
VVFYSGLQFPETLTYLSELASTWNLNCHDIPADPDLRTVIAAGGFDHHAPDRELTGALADIIMITGPRRCPRTPRYGRGSLWGCAPRNPRPAVTSIAQAGPAHHSEFVTTPRGRAGIVRWRRAAQKRGRHLLADLGLAGQPRLRIPRRA